MLALGLSLLSLFFSAVSGVIDTDHYTVWTIPDGASNVVTNTTTGVALIGGGEDCVPAFQWQISNAGMGDFVIIRASGDDDYNQFVFDLSVSIGLPLNSVTTILFKDSMAATDANVLNLIRNADAIFIAGGDQGKYLAYWSGTPVQDVLQDKVSHVTISGTSAGLAIMGNWVYSATEGSAYSDESLLDPYNKYITIAYAFLRIPFLGSVITDTHFAARDRMGRLLAFVARIITDNNLSTNVRGVGVDEETALLLNIHTGEAKTVGKNNAYICTEAAQTIRCLPDNPISTQILPCVRLSAVQGDVYSFASWKPVQGGVNYDIQVDNGWYSSSTHPYGP